MLRTILAAALAVAGFGGTPMHTTSAPLEHFAVVVEHAPTQGWAATCETGCRWKTATLDCRGCEVRIDAGGISLATAPAERTERFAFVLHDDASGWGARALHGTSWNALSWECRTVVCRARIDETGVGKLM